MEENERQLGTVSRMRHTYCELIRAAKELELEGIIAKRKDSLYEPGRRSIRL
jgi:ATP-dependent DNA ligase